MTTRSQSVSNLNADELRSFQVAWNIFAYDSKEYEVQKKNIQDLKGWFMDTIAQQYRDSSCDPTESLHKWYTQLKEHASVGEVMDKKAVRSLYKTAIKPLNKPPRDWNSWINAWEEAMSLGQQKKVPDTTDPTIWFEEFIEAVNPAVSQWATAYKLQKEDEADKGTLTYRMVAYALRHEVRSKAKGGSVAKGSFGPTYGQESAPSEQSDDARDDSHSEGKQTKSKRGKKRHRDSRDSTSATGGSMERCLVCECIGHKTQDCFYAFPENDVREVDLDKLASHLQRISVPESDQLPQTDHATAGQEDMNLFDLEDNLEGDAEGDEEDIDQFDKAEQAVQSLLTPPPTPPAALLAASIQTPLMEPSEPSELSESSRSTDKYVADPKEHLVWQAAFHAGTVGNAVAKVDGQIYDRAKILRLLQSPKPRIHRRNLPAPPTRHHELADHPMGHLFEQAELDHLKSHADMQSWTEILRSSIPKKLQVLDCMWVYVYKFDKHGRFIKCKARLSRTRRSTSSVKPVKHLCGYAGGKKFSDSHCHRRSLRPRAAPVRCS